MSRRDDVNGLYKQSQSLNSICQALFWVNVGLSMLSLMSFVTIPVA